MQEKQAEIPKHKRWYSEPQPGQEPTQESIMFLDGQEPQSPITEEESPSQVLDRILAQIGYTRYHIFYTLSMWALYMAMGSQVYCLNMLMPMLEQKSGHHIFHFMAFSLFIGFILGTVISGVLVTHFTRASVVRTTVLIFAIFSVVPVVYEMAELIIASRLIIGISMGILGPQTVSNYAEILPAKFKEFFILSLFIWYRIGVIYFVCCYGAIMPNYQFENWRIIYAVAFAPVGLTLFLTYMYYFDSAKFLLSRNHTQDVADQLFFLASLKKVDVPEDDINYVRESNIYKNPEKANKELVAYAPLFALDTRRISILCLLLYICSSSINICNMYSLPLILQTDGQDKTLEIIITQVVNIPSVILSAVLCKVVGRRVTIMMGFIMCLVVCFASAFIDKTVIASITLSNFFIIISICAIRLYVIEAFNTRLRHHALALYAGVAKMGDILTPLLCNYTMELAYYGPIICNNLLCLFGLIFSCFLPYDTLGLRTD